jgi:hypothetical protein
MPPKVLSRLARFHATLSYIAVTRLDPAPTDYREMVAFIRQASQRRVLSPAIWSDELRVMFRPIAAYRSLAAAGSEPGTWALVRRPLASTVIVGAFVSFAATNRLVAEFIADGILWWSFLPMLQAGLIALTMLGFARRNMSMSMPRAISLFFVGSGPWWVWLLGMSVVAAFAPSGTTDGLPAHSGRFLLAAALAALVWSIITTFGFLYGALGLSARRATAGTLMYNVAFWGTLIGYLFAVDMLQLHNLDV